jgi:CBS domain-containing protein
MATITAKGKVAADIMQREVITVHENWDIREALSIFEEKHISGAPVVDGDGDLVGVLSVTDLARAKTRADGHGESEYYRTLMPEDFPTGIHVERYEPIPVCEVMTPLVIDAPETTPVARLAALMVDLHIHRVIITRGGKLVGIVSSLDLLKLMKHETKNGD